MSGYTKLFNSILASTIWRADNDTRIVWITLLAMADRRGIVEASVPGLADFARVPIPQCEKALAMLMSPDEHSRSKDQDGRRIEPVDGGWRLINHAKYRSKLNEDERREYQRVWQSNHRKRRQKMTSVDTVDSVDSMSTMSGELTHPDTDTEKIKIKSIDPAHKPRERSFSRISEVQNHQVLVALALSVIRQFPG